MKLKTFFLPLLLLPLYLVSTPLPAAESCSDQKCDACKNSEEEKDPAPTYLIPLSLGECGDITFKPGLRVQTRYLYDSIDNNNDIFIRRFRLKAGGMAFDIAKYYLELKVDKEGRFNAEPRGRIENAWLDFTLCKDLGYLRVGLYDVPFSRNALTSDSKLLFMDRSLIKFALTKLGVVDNTVGVMLHGRPYGAHIEYAFGIFDNFEFDRITDSRLTHSDQLMPAGRLVINFLQPNCPHDGYADYRGSYICKGHRLAIGTNGAYLGDAEYYERNFNLYAWGVDLFYNYYRFTFQAEYDRYFEEGRHDTYDRNGYGWYVQAGYLIYGPVELAARYQELDSYIYHEDGKLRWTSIGMNIYIREHHLKIQTDYTLRRDSPQGSSHLYQIQLQLDY